MKYHKPWNEGNVGRVFEKLHDIGRWCLRTSFADRDSNEQIPDYQTYQDHVRSHTDAWTEPHSWNNMAVYINQIWNDKIRWSFTWELDNMVSTWLPNPGWLDLLIGNDIEPRETPVRTTPYANPRLFLKWRLTMAFTGVKRHPVPSPIPRPWLRKT